MKREPKTHTHSLFMQEHQHKMNKTVEKQNISEWKAANYGPECRIGLSEHRCIMHSLCNILSLICDALHKCDVS